MPGKKPAQIKQTIRIPPISLALSTPDEPSEGPGEFGDEAVRIRAHGDRHNIAEEIRALARHVEGTIGPRCRDAVIVVLFKHVVNTSG